MTDSVYKMYNTPDISLKYNQKKKAFAGILPKLQYDYRIFKSKFHMKKVKNLEFFNWNVIF